MSPESLNPIDNPSLLAQGGSGDGALLVSTFFHIRANMNGFSPPEETAISVAAGVIVREDGCYLLARKKNGLSNGGRWEFPGGKIEPNETAEQALARELDEELGLESEGPYLPLLQYDWSGSSKSIHFHFFLVRTNGFVPLGRDHDQFAWIRPGENVELDVVEADKRALAFLTENQELIGNP